MLLELQGRAFFTSNIIVAVDGSSQSYNKEFVANCH